ncbi:intraflagellar transport-associated protein isoform X4 [Misgurnus anguillicaudatus]|uniref:intraflagellar transport-associated protein isoform X4 n=1 Tax=Misgurnus anguillicaudatus TaxID=75329 RepID=UPI003CCFB213
MKHFPRFAGLFESRRLDRMPGLVQGSDIDDHDQAITEALDQFCSAPEQTYEQFFSTFTYLTPEDVRGPRVTAHRRHGDSSHSSQEEQREDEVSEMEREESTLTTDQEEFDNYLGDSEDEEETTDVTGTSVLPGEVEEHLDASASSLCHHTLLEMSSTFTDQSTDKTQTAEDQNESDMVLPFHLDENFDYDTVVLTRKHSIREQNHRPS